MDADHADDSHRTTQRPPAHQLRLLDTPAPGDWRLDDTTRAVGKRGIEMARAALETARRRDAASDNKPRNASGASTAA